MKSTVLPARIFVLICVSFTITTSAQSIVTDPPEREKPYLVLNPADPAANKDTVTLKIMLGTASNSCVAPTFSNCSYSLEQSKLTSLFTLEVTFTRHLLPEGTTCPSIYNPVDYGPIFHLGQLMPGTYQVVEGKTATVDTAVSPVVYGTFTIPDERIIEPVTFSMKGTVGDDPFPMKRASMPVENAVVYLSTLDLNQRGRFETVEQLIAAGLRDSSATDENGNYRFDSVPSGTFIVSIAHPKYRMSPVMMSAASDTTVNFVLISSEASAAVTGCVKLEKADNAGTVPVEGCIVSVRKNRNTTSTGVEDLVPPKPPLQVTTDSEGNFTVENIPITANGESWLVTAAYKSLSLSYWLSKTVILSNMFTDSADFIFDEPYSNSTSVVDDGITFTIAASKKTYSVDEPLQMRYSITNSTESPVTFGSFSEGCEYDLVIRREGGRVVYRESVTRDCPDIVSTVEVGPGETVTHTLPLFSFSEHLYDILEGAASAPQTIGVTISARLMGEEYDVTEAGVPVVIDCINFAGARAPATAHQTSDVKFNAARNTLIFTLERPQTVSFQVYTLDGALMPLRSTGQHLAAGRHVLTLKGIVAGRGKSSGVCIIGIRGDGFEKRFRTVNLAR